MTKTEQKMNKLIGQNLDGILDGTMLAIDPGSNSMGYAIFREGEFEISGELKGKGVAQKRLHEIADQLVELETPDVLAIELIRKNHTLIWSIGTTIASVRTQNLIEVPILLWHQLRDEHYEKTDALDAQLIGQCVINRAKMLRKWK